MLKIKEIDEIQKRLLMEVADLHKVPEGAVNIRANGELAIRNTTANIDIVSKENGSGIDIKIKPGTKNESVQPQGSRLQRLFHRRGLRCRHRGRLRY